MGDQGGQRWPNRAGLEESKACRKFMCNLRPPVQGACSCGTLYLHQAFFVGMLLMGLPAHPQ